MRKANSPKNPSLRKTRIRIVLTCALFLLGFSLLTARAFTLHLTDNKRLSSLAKNQYKRRVVVAPKRGNILDTNYETLAIDIRVNSVYATPHRIKDPQALATRLAEVLDTPKKKMLRRLRDSKKKFVWIQRRISPEQSERLEKLDLSGIGMLPEFKRFYPNGELGANLLGAVGYDAQALSGLELSQDKILKSQDPPILVEQDAKGRSYAPYGLVGKENPNQLVLTIDKTIQYIADRELTKQVKQTRAKGGVAIVLEVKTGAILALSVYPNFDPNKYYKYEFKDWRNRAITDVFEPGSTFKAFTATVALDLGVSDMKKSLHCGNGSLKVGSNVIHDHHPYGNLTLPEIIKYSSNICSYKLAQKIGKKRFFKYIKDFGFGSKSGIPLPGEQVGIVPSLKRVRDIQLGTIGFGQGISTTPLQMAMAYGAIANGGFLMKPFLIKEMQDSRGNTLKKFGPKIARQVLSPESAKKGVAMLKTVVEKGGTGTRAKVEGYQVAGKTGTAQKVIEGQKGYAKNKYVASFVGMAPAEDPKLVILVTIDEPKGGYYGGLVSGPVFSKIMGPSLAYLKIAPSSPISPQQAPLRAAKRLASLDKKVAPEKKSEKKSALPQPSGPSENPAANSQDQGLSDGSGIRVPQLTGLSVREAFRKLQATNLHLKIQGTGICLQQEPVAGELVQEGSSITLECSPPI